jgi:hypothetical protein
MDLWSCLQIFYFLCLNGGLVWGTSENDQANLSQQNAIWSTVIANLKLPRILDEAGPISDQDDVDTLSSKFPEFSDDFVTGLVKTGRTRAEELFGVALNTSRSLADSDVPEFSKRQLQKPIVASEFPVVENSSAAAGLGRFGAMTDRVVTVSQQANVLLDITKGIVDRFVLIHHSNTIYSKEFSLTDSHISRLSAERNEKRDNFSPRTLRDLRFHNFVRCVHFQKSKHVSCGTCFLNDFLEIAKFS